jgi:hypothetical protein
MPWPRSDVEPKASSRKRRNKESAATLDALQRFFVALRACAWRASLIALNPRPTAMALIRIAARPEKCERSLFPTSMPAMRCSPNLRRQRNFYDGAIYVRRNQIGGNVF